MRIFPLFYLAVVLGIVLTPLAIAHAPSKASADAHFPPFHEWAFYLVYLQNWIIPLTNHDILGHFWSLGVEEQFYLLWPWCVWIAPRKWLHWLCLVGIAVAIVVRFMLAHFVDPMSRVLLMNTFCRMDSLLLGAVCAIAVRSDRWAEAARRLILPVAFVAFATTFTIDLVAGDLAAGYAALLLAGYFQSGSGRALRKRRTDRHGPVAWSAVR